MPLIIIASGQCAGIISSSAPATPTWRSALDHVSLAPMPSPEVAHTGFPKAQFTRSLTGRASPLFAKGETGGTKSFPASLAALWRTGGTS